MAIALVTGQVISGSGTGGTTGSLVLPNNPANGNFVVFTIICSSAISGVKDANLNTFVPTTKSPFIGSDGSSQGIWYLENVSSGSKTITVTFAAGGIYEIWAAEFS